MIKICKVNIVMEREEKCMNIAYLQVDLRYNKWLLKKIRDKYVVEYTLDRIRELDCEKIIAGIYNCKENESLIKFLTMRGGG